MATDTNSCALSGEDYELVKHVIKIKELENLKWSESSIYKVPSNLREVKKEAYTPQLISIGPLHYGIKEFEPMQEQKAKYLYFLRKRDGVSHEDLETYKGYLKRHAEKIRNYYAQKFPHIDEDEFVELILLDAVFIMEHILRIRELKSKYKSRNKDVEMDSESFRSKHGVKMDSESFRSNLSDDYILTQSWLSKSIHRDLLLLENQIPMFVLKKLYKVVIRGDNKQKEHPSFLELAVEYFAIYAKSATDETKQSLEELKPKVFIGLEENKSLNNLMEKLKKVGLEEQKHMDKPKHFTDLIRYFYLPTPTPTPLRSFTSPASILRTVTKLQEAGLSFEKVQKRCLLDIEFVKKPILSWFLCLGCLPRFEHFKARVQIPQLKVDHTTECVLRNLIAFEQCHYPLEPYICNYVSMIDSLIHTKDDVELLVEKEIIVHELGSDKEVATLVNGLCKHVVTHTNYYGKVIDRINEHYQNTWFHYMAALRFVYFRDPWRASSTLVGIAVLVFAIFNFCRVIKFVI